MRGRPGRPHSGSVGSTAPSCGPELGLTAAGSRLRTVPEGHHDGVEGRERGHHTGHVPGGQLDLHGADYLREFRLENGLPVWTYHVRDLVLEKRVILPHLQNTVHLTYRILDGANRFGIGIAKEEPAVP